MTALRKNETVTFRMDSTSLDMIQRAAAGAGKSVTAFVTEAATLAAQKQLLDRRFLALDPSDFDAIATMLDEDGKAQPELVKLFANNRVWLD